MLLGESYVERGASAEDDRDGDINVSITGLVDTEVVGIYIITYLATDSAGNNTVMARAVSVVIEDKVAPAITLNGEASIIVIQGSNYNDAGAVAFDERDGEIDVASIGAVDTSLVGIYGITYTAVDSAGNSASINRTITVVLPDDTESPVITLEGQPEITLIQGGEYIEAGATAIDERDGILSVSISGTVNTDVLSVYMVTYTAIDSAGNTAIAIRTVTVELGPDTVPPVITLEGISQVTIIQGDDYIEAGATSLDERDGELSVTITGFVDTSLGGEYIVTYSATDSSNNIATVYRTVTVITVNRVVYYISPNGSDQNDGLSIAAPWLSFEYAFSENGLAAGDELALLDGTYSIINGTGILREVDSNGNGLQNSGSIPSGINRDHPTIIRAANQGAVTIDGAGIKPISIGRSDRKDRFIDVSGILFEGGGSMFNSEYVAFKKSGFHGSLSIGTSSHNNGNDNNLVEDVWVWASNKRIVALNYRAHQNVWRRVLVRSEGCDELGCEGAPKPDPSVGITVYDSHDVSLQNVMVVDRLLRNDGAYADFATAQHTGDESYYLGRNEWLGNMSINSQDTAIAFEADYILENGDPIWTIKHFLSIGGNKTGVNIGNRPSNYISAGSPPSLLDNITVLISDGLENISGIRVSPEQTTVEVQNSLVKGATRTGYNVLGSSVENSVGYNPGSGEGEFDTRNCIVNCVALDSDPIIDGSFLSPLKIESNSIVDETIDGVEIGATIINRYGVSGSFFGDDDYNTLTQESLWPWPHEVQIKQEMCVDQGIERGFCNTGLQLDNVKGVTLTSYIWELLGNLMPEYVYSN